MATTRGRKSKYREEYAQQAYKFCLLGATNEQLADFFEVNQDTIHAWSKRHKEFSDALRRAKNVADAEVAHGLFRRGVGFQYEEETFEKIQLLPEGEEDIKRDAYKRKVVTKHVIPDPGAAMNWLSNRQPDKWRNRQDINAKIDHRQLLDNMSEEQLIEIARLMLKQQNTKQ